jgi:Xaa-Pro dipeptidase
LQAAAPPHCCSRSSRPRNFSKLSKKQGLIRANVLESQLNQDVYDLAEKMFGISTYWHKRIVRAGRNTLAPYDENPPDLTVGHDDILFLDLGPVFEEWEADFGRTFVVGSDPLKRKLRDDVATGFKLGKK